MRRCFRSFLFFFLSTTSFFYFSRIKKNMAICWRSLLKMSIREKNTQREYCCFVFLFSDGGFVTLAQKHTHNARRKLCAWATGTKCARDRSKNENKRKREVSGMKRWHERHTAITSKSTRKLKKKKAKCYFQHRWWSFISHIILYAMHLLIHDVWWGCWSRSFLVLKKKTEWLLSDKSIWKITAPELLM